jgi:hypothetical protein
MYLELFILAGLGAFIVLFVSSAVLEKQHLHEFAPAPAGESGSDSAYFNAINMAAERLGFEAAGTVDQNRASRLYRARLALWVSPDREILLLVGGGKTAGVPIKRTILITVIDRDRIIQTQDDFAMADLSGLTDRKVVLNADLDELLSSHRERCAAQHRAKRHFSIESALSNWESIQEMKARQLSRLGLIKFLNREETIWRHTLKGAWLQYFKGFRGQLAEGKSQKERISRKRPGST